MATTLPIGHRLRSAKVSPTHLRARSPNGIHELRARSATSELPRKRSGLNSSGFGPKYLCGHSVSHSTLHNVNHRLQ